MGWEKMMHQEFREDFCDNLGEETVYRDELFEVSSSAEDASDYDVRKAIEEFESDTYT